MNSPTDIWRLIVQEDLSPASPRCNLCRRCYSSSNSCLCQELSSNKLGNMNTKIGNSADLGTPALARLPAELVQLVTVQLFVDDAKSFYQALKVSREHYQVALYALSRISVKDYIKSNLGDPGIILKSMSHNLVYLSGSGALEFFKPGIRTPKSDWDFYAPDDVKLVSSFMYDMEKVGVKWRSPLDQVQKYMEEDGGYVRFAHTAFLEVLDSGALLQVVCRQGFKLMRWDGLHETWTPVLTKGTNMIKDEVMPYHYLTIDTGKKLVTVQRSELWQEYEQIELIKYIVRGELQRNNTKVEVQLMVEQRQHPLDTPAVFNYHSSAVQCFIGAHVACHFYGQSTSRNLTHVWKYWIANKKNRRAIKKYADRGFKKHDIPPRPPGLWSVCRFAHGDQSTMVGKYNFTNREDWIAKAMYLHARVTAWLESPEKTQLVETPYKKPRDKDMRNYHTNTILSGHTAGLKMHPCALQWVKEGQEVDVSLEHVDNR